MLAQTSVSVDETDGEKNNTSASACCRGGHDSLTSIEIIRTKCSVVGNTDGKN
jgi:hypothetical protein